MNFADILALAKQGYKPSDIKELLTIPTDNSNLSTSDDLDDPKDGVKTPTPSEGESDQPKEEKKEEPKQNPLDDELKALRAELEQTKKALAKAQDANKREPMVPEKKSDPLEDIVRKFM